MTVYLVLSTIGTLLFVILSSIYGWGTVRVRILGIITIELRKSKKIKKRKKTRDSNR